jgi:hypothetical protein
MLSVPETVADELLSWPPPAIFVGVDPAEARDRTGWVVCTRHERRADGATLWLIRDAQAFHLSYDDFIDWMLKTLGRIKQIQPFVPDVEQTITVTIDIGGPGRPLYRILDKSDRLPFGVELTGVNITGGPSRTLAGPGVVNFGEKPLVDNALELMLTDRLKSAQGRQFDDLLGELRKIETGYDARGHERILARRDRSGHSDRAYALALCVQSAYGPRPWSWRDQEGARALSRVSGW